MNDFVQNVDSFVKPMARRQKKPGLQGRVWKEGGSLVNYQWNTKHSTLQIHERLENILLRRSGAVYDQTVQNKSVP